MKPLGRTARHPFDGNPETREETDENGNISFRVTGRVLTPVWAKIADKLGAATAAAGAVAGAIYVVNHNYPPIALAAAAGIWFGRPLFEKLWREALRRKVHMMVTADEFRFRRGLGWISFDRALQHRFALVVHDLARLERDQHELQIVKAQRQKKIVQPKRYYQDSYHFTYELLGQRNDITEIFSRPEAQAVLARLRAIDDVINARAKRSDGTALKPGDQWAEGPGAIPETGDD
jgi:hypothetical protein